MVLLHNCWDRNKKDGGGGGAACLIYVMIVLGGLAVCAAVCRSDPEVGQGWLVVMEAEGTLRQSTEGTKLS